jgi:hypothetical protein
MSFAQKAIVYKGPEDVYGPCGCGGDLAILPVLVPKSWYVEDCPEIIKDHSFCMGEDQRRVSGFSCNNIFDHEIGGEAFLANFSCCRECAIRAVEFGYAVWSDKEYPMTLR